MCDHVSFLVLEALAGMHAGKRRREREGRVETKERERETAMSFAGEKLQLAIIWAPV